jgi:hypothetical protein
VGSSIVQSRVLAKSSAHSFAKNANEWGTLIVLATRPSSSFDGHSVTDRQTDRMSRHFLRLGWFS